MAQASHKVAIIAGVSGQDGAYLARFLLRRNYRVVGTTRDRGGTFANLRALNVLDSIELHQLDLTDGRAVMEFCSSVRPDEIYHLSAQSSVAESFARPSESIRSCIETTLCLLEAVRCAVPSARLFNATSSECFGDTPPSGASETTAFSPRSPYAVGKAAAHMTVQNYRAAYGLYCCSGILFNHESPLRAARYVTRKIIEGARDIAHGKADQLRLGSLDVVRDWGCAVEYVEAMWLMLRRPAPDDFVIATGKASSLRDFLAAAFERFGLRWQDHVLSDPSLLRPQDILFSAADVGKAHRELGWKARTVMPDVVASMASDLEAMERQRA
jgi:GDPmannose 4,6-dehydratase